MSRSKKNKAVALKYNAQEDLAPIVIASGYGDVAKRIIEVAESRGIPVFRDDSAVSLLCMLEVGSNIPPNCMKQWQPSICSCCGFPSRLKIPVGPPQAQGRAPRPRTGNNRADESRHLQKEESGIWKLISSDSPYSMTSRR